MDNNEYVKYCPICNETKQNVKSFKDEIYKEFSKGYLYVLTPKDNSEICPFCHRGG